MKKNSNSGFVLAETLVVTLFLMIIFTMLYVNFYPLIGEYEKRETYDDVDGKYAAYWIKRFIEDGSYKIGNKAQELINKGYARFECSDIDEAEKRKTCINLVQNLEIENCNNQGNLCEIYITKYRLSGPEGTVWFKTTVENNNEKKFRSGFRDYIELLPDYKTESINHAKYRVIISIHHTEDSNNYYSYSTIEVNR